MIYTSNFAHDSFKIHCELRGIRYKIVTWENALFLINMHVAGIWSLNYYIYNVSEFAWIYKIWNSDAPNIAQQLRTQVIVNSYVLMLLRRG